MGTTETKKMRVGVVGCGAISDIYLTNMIHNFENLEVAACCAGHLEHAKKKAEQYGIKGCTYEEILADPSIEMVVILTPAPTHEGLIRQALEAGKHVYTEKTMTLAPETAAKLIELAEEKHLYLGSAPDTFLGSALQTARKAIDDGLIGEVTSFEACANRDLDLLASIFRFLRMPGGGICYDFGVYYLTAIVSLFGPVDRVVSSVRNLAPKRVNVVPDSPEYGQEFDYNKREPGFHDSGNEKRRDRHILCQWRQHHQRSGGIHNLRQKRYFKAGGPEQFRRRYRLHSGREGLDTAGSSGSAGLWLCLQRKQPRPRSVRDGRSNCRGQTKPCECQNGISRTRYDRSDYEECGNGCI